MTIHHTSAPLAALLALLAPLPTPAAPAPLHPAFDGGAEVALEAPAGGGSRTALSEEVRLEVGRLYRLSATVAARRLSADPAARWPTALGACVAMASTPFTNCSPAVAGDQRRRVEHLFFAVASRDRVALHLGRNGPASGAATFSEVSLEPVDDVTRYLPLERVRWSGPGFRYDDGGWIFVHVEGAPYARGRQYGELVAPELVRYLEKLAALQDKADPEKGWKGLRRLADALLLRGFDVEYLEEMKGIADGAARTGAKFKGREVDLLDVVTLNSAVDLGQLDDGLKGAPTPLTGRTFLTAEDEAAAAPGTDRCSSFVATKSATRDGRFVMGQLFMWNGYSGVHFDVMLDVVPEQGHRLVFQTFPGGIHSGTDWYLNAAGIVIGETTVGQTPFEPKGTPQANRARRAAQYASSIDEVARILREKNNGLYTNDWTIADAKTDEGADLLLGTRASRLWRTGAGGKGGDTPGGLKDFIWANNNTRDPEVRAEYAATPDGAPVDLSFTTWNRDIAFWRFYQARGKGGIDLEAAIRLQASSPVNRPHACDGKLTTGEMAERLVFLAHYGKTTQREKWPGGRWIADLPNAVPHLTQGYTTFSPVVVADGLKAARARAEAAARVAAPVAPAGGPPAAAAAPFPPKDPPAPKADPSAPALAEQLTFDKKLLWSWSVRPATDADAWFTAGSAAYHALLRDLPKEPEKALEAQRLELGGLAARHAWLEARDRVTPPLTTGVDYGRYGAGQGARIRGTFALHQLRLQLGNAAFSKVMNAVHRRYAGQKMSTAQFFEAAEQAAGRELRTIVTPWLERADLPDPEVTATVTGPSPRPSPQGGEGGEAQAPKFRVTLTVVQPGPWRYATTVALTGPTTVRYERVLVERERQEFTFEVAERPTRLRFAATADVATPRDQPYQMPSMLDDFSTLLWVQGTERELEANRTLALLWREVVADAFVEVLPPLRQDAELSEGDLRDHDLVLVGGPADNGAAARLLASGKVPLEAGQGWFRFQGRTYARPDDGLMLALRSPFDPARAVYLTLANSKVQLWRMVKAYQRGLPGWALWKEGEVAEKGLLHPARLEVALP